MRVTSKQKTSVLAGIEAAIGLITIARAPAIASAPWLGLPRSAMITVVRVLGARQALQAVALARFNEPAMLTAGAAVDGMHALSMLPVAARPGPYRGQAALSAALASALAAAELATARSSQ